MKRSYTISILLSSALISILFLFNEDTQSRSNENFSDCEKKIYAIESQIKKAHELKNRDKIKYLKITLQSVNKKCKSIL